MGQPELAAANTAYLKELQTLSLQASSDVREQVEAYLAQHPPAPPKT